MVLGTARTRRRLAAALHHFGIAEQLPGKDEGKGKRPPQGTAFKPWFLNLVSGLSEGQGRGLVLSLEHSELQVAALLNYYGIIDKWPGKGKGDRGAGKGEDGNEEFAEERRAR